jgi:hypothetical protein
VSELPLALGLQLVHLLQPILSTGLILHVIRGSFESQKSVDAFDHSNIAVPPIMEEVRDSRHVLSAAAVIRAVQSEKQFSPMERAGDSLSFARAEQSLKASSPIIVTPFGMVMAVRELTCATHASNRNGRFLLIC